MRDRESALQKALIKGDGAHLLMGSTVASTLCDWLRGRADGHITSLGVFSDGQHSCYHFLHFWATVCKTVCPIGYTIGLLSVLSLSVLSCLKRKRDTAHSITLCDPAPAPAHGRNGRCSELVGHHLPHWGYGLGCHLRKNLEISDADCCFLAHFQPEN